MDKVREAIYLQMQLPPFPKGKTEHLRGKDVDFLWTSFGQ